MKKDLYWYDKLLIGAFSLFIVIIAIWITVVPLTKSKSFYMNEYQKYNTVEETGYSKEELEVITEQIIAYLFNKTDDMQVEIGGEIVFSNQALIHMKDVRDLYNGGQVIALIILFLTIAIGAYMFYNYKRLQQHFLVYSVRVFAVVGIIIIVIGILAIIDFNQMFDIFHRVIFPNEQKYQDAFFSATSNYAELPGVNNLMLVTILSIGLFMDVGIIVGSFAMFVLVAWFTYCYILRKKYNLKEVQHEL